MLFTTVSAETETLQGFEETPYSMRYNYSLEPVGRLVNPCMGCGRYYGTVGNHIRKREGEIGPNCPECFARGIIYSKDNRDMIAKLNEIGVVYEYRVSRHDAPALFTGYGRPRRLTDEEVASVIEIQNPLYDVSLAERFPYYFEDAYPQNPKMIRILGAKRETAEAMQRDMDEQKRILDQQENFASTFNPLDFAQEDFAHDDM